jgi:hypothetical protein
MVSVSGFDHGVGHPSASGRGKSISGLEERGCRGLEFFSKVTYTMIEAQFRLYTTLAVHSRPTQGYVRGLIYPRYRRVSDSC